MRAARRGRRRSRRWFLGALGAAAGAAGLAALGCDDGEGEAPATVATTTQERAPAEAHPTYASTPAPDPTRASAGGWGGTLRIAAGFDSRDRFDPHSATSPSLLGAQALTYSRLLTYASQAEGALQPDLALAMPEQPDELTYIFQLHPEARWHDVAPLEGRPVTANDVIVSIERQRTGSGEDFPRRERWAPIAVEAAGETVIARTEAPFAGTLARFASPEGFVVPPELEGAFSPTQQVGSGPFRWIEWLEGSYASVARNGAWHGSEGNPFLDGISIVPPRSTDELEADFRTREVDAVEAGFVRAQELRQRLPELNEARSAVARFYGMRFLSGLPPYNDPRLRRALTVAIDRRAMLERFFERSGTLNPWISAAVRRWALPQADLQREPGYRPGGGGRSLDVQDARASLEAYREEHELPDPMELLVTVEVEEGSGIGALIAGQLYESLGLNVAVQPVSITELSERLVAGEAPWAVGIDDGWIELDDWLYPYFHSEGSLNTFALRDEELDALIEEQRTELSGERRQEIAHTVQRRLLELNVGVNFVSEEVVTLFWPYVQAFPVDAGVAYQDRFAGTWLNRDDPTYLARAWAGAGERGQAL